MDQDADVPASCVATALGNFIVFCPIHAHTSRLRTAHSMVPILILKHIYTV